MPLASQHGGFRSHSRRGKIVSVCSGNSVTGVVVAVVVAGTVTGVEGAIGMGVEGVEAHDTEGPAPWNLFFIPFCISSPWFVKYLPEQGVDPAKVLSALSVLSTLQPAIQSNMGS